MVKRSASGRMCGILLALAGVHLLASPVAAEPEDRPVVTCSAIRVQDRLGAGPSPWAVRRPDLVIVGTYEPGHGTVDVEEIFYGMVDATRLELSGVSRRLRDGRNILAIGRSPYPDERWRLKDAFLPTPENMAGARVLGAARLTYHTLASRLVLVGREVAYADVDDLQSYETEEDVRDVRVSRVLAGPPGLAGTTVRIRIGRFLRHSGKPPPLTEGERTFFLEGGNDQPDPDRPPFFVSTAVLPGSVAPRVSALLLERDHHPVVEAPWREGVRRERQILFRGPIDEAILILGSDLEGAAHLASTSLVLRREESRQAVVTTIEAHLFDACADADASLRRQRNLIRILGEIERREPRGDLPRLLETCFARMTADDPRAADANHSLAWLLLALGEPEARAAHGRRLLDLREEARGRWNDEVRFALDALRVEDTLVLLAALERTRSLDVTRVTRREVHVPGGTADEVAFSNRGDRLAFRSRSGVRIWNTADWSDAAALDVKGSISRLTFSPDDRHLYVAGGGGVARYDATTGRLDRTYEAHATGVGSMELSPDGRTLATHSYHEKELLFLDTATGAILRRVSATGVGLEPVLGGGGVLCWCGAAGWIHEPFRDGKAESFRLPDGKSPSWLSNLVVSRDGALGACVNEDVVPSFSKRAGSVTLLGRKGGGNETLGRLDLESATMLQYTAISPDGKLFAAAGNGNVIRLFSLPDFAPVGEVRFPRPSSSKLTLSDLEFSPDSRLLAVGRREPRPGLVRLDGLEKQRPWTGHRDRISMVRFGPDGKTVHTLGRDDTVCTWDASTLELRARRALPVGDSGARAQWVPGAPELLLAHGDELCWFDYETGETVFRVARSGHAEGWLTEDSRFLFHAWAGLKGPGEVEATRIDVRSGEVAHVPPARDVSIFARRGGLVPGGRYFFLTEEDTLHLFDRETGERVAHRDCPGIGAGSLCFDGDGKHHAVTTSFKNLPEEMRAACGPDARCVIVVSETLSGKIRFVVPSDTGGASAMSPDGRRLALVGSDGSLTILTLPGPK